VKLIVDEQHMGPAEQAWTSRLRSAHLEPLGALHARRLVVVTPHPDDEVLGAAGLIQQALAEKVLVEIIAVTDGEASHPGSTVAARSDLAEIRSRETDNALRRLGWDKPAVTRLHLPDGDVSSRRRDLDVALRDVLLPDDLCVAPWRLDGHPDHDVCGESALNAARAVGARSLSFLVWTWHWADPHGADVPWHRCRQLNLNRRAQARKRWSTLAFTSQIEPLGPDEADAPILPAPLLRRYWRPFEVFVDESLEVA
jgi:LmbE family N-acetylglucosaminyl deacetylase